MPEAMECEVIAPPSISRLQIREAARLAYISGRARLVELAEEYAIPLETMQRWSHEADWGAVKSVALKEAGDKAATEAASWLADQREGQIRRGIGRALRIQSGIDKAILDEVGNARPLDAKDAQGYATAEEKLDLVCRRNLGMDATSAAGTTVNVNVLGSCEVGGWGA